MKTIARIITTTAIYLFLLVFVSVCQVNAGYKYFAPGGGLPEEIIKRDNNWAEGWLKHAKMSEPEDDDLVYEQGDLDYHRHIKPSTPQPTEKLRLMKCKNEIEEIQLIFDKWESKQKSKGGLTESEVSSFELDLMLVELLLESVELRCGYDLTDVKIEVEDIKAQITRAMRKHYRGE